ncbi:MAG: phenylalanine--tRNA ligase subunit beta [Marinilabiliales bacterium]|nr:MAG: phenylalanine--tRNA ligase subunit beta [Marinilabiliales bacterium]
MNISYNWLQNYIKIDDSLDKLSEVLTQIGLEVGSIDNFQSIEGGLEGFVTGHVLTCEKHPNADKLSITTVDIGTDEILNIVCGAPNVAAGQKVIVATVGTTLYTPDGSFQIKKAKIRGEVSQGMICAEDEIGIGSSHAGIMELPEDTKVGIAASDYFKIEKDTVIEIDLTPNRVDAASHIGVARDLAAYYKTNYTLPSVDIKIPEEESFKIDVEVENPEACPRYMGICLDNITITESPDWLKNKLKAIGLNPINNIVDITNFVLHETGHPLHAFDGDKIKGNKIIVKTEKQNTPFTTLDEIERKLNETDLMICNANDSMCIAGVFGGIESGISKTTKRIFIESAYFNPTWVRKTAKSHTLSTDSSFRFERGADVNMAPYALKRAASLIQELGFGEISSKIVDIYPKTIEKNRVNFNYNNCDRLIGQKIDREEIQSILKSLEIDIIEENGEDLILEIPTYRVDVYREADVIEDILRIYGYNSIKIPEKIEISVNKLHKPDNEKLTNLISDMLVAQGFNEIMCNSFISDKYFDDDAGIVKLHNPLSKDLSIMRPEMLYGGLESIEYNINRKNADIKMFEFGRIYHADKSNNNISDIERYSETKQLALWISGKENPLNLNKKDEKSDYFYLKAYLNNVFSKIGIDLDNYEFEIISDNRYKISQKYTINNKVLVQAGIVSKKVLQNFDIDQEVFYAEINWDTVLELVKGINPIYTPVSKFPAVKRDLALLIDKNISYKKLQDIAVDVIGKNLTKINLFDVYEGKNIEDGKVSYALSYILEDKNKTMTDKQIDKMMQKLMKAYEEIGAKIR